MSNELLQYAQELTSNCIIAVTEEGVKRNEQLICELQQVCDDSNRGMAVKVKDIRASLLDAQDRCRTSTTSCC